MKYYTALFQKIKDYYKSQSSNPNEVALICPSLRVYENSELKLLLPQILLDESVKGEALLKKQDLSFQLNSIPSSDKFWDINPANTLFNAYDQIISVDQKESISLDTIENEEAKKVLFDAKGKATKEKKAYDKYLGLFDTLLTEWEEHVAKFPDLQTEEEKEAWKEKLNNILLRKEKIAVDHKLLGYKKLIENAMKKINENDGFDIFLANLNNSRNIMEVSKKTGIQSLESYYDINFVPYDFMSNDSGWIKLSLTKAELDQLYETAKSQKHEFPEEILSIDYDEKNIIGIELEFNIITMLRNWFSLSSITSEYFKWNEASPISDGETISNDFPLPAFTKKFIVLRNLKINIDPTIEANAVNNINQLIHFGPIIMKNQLFVNSSNNIRFIKAIRDKETLTSSNLKYYSSKVSTETPPIKPPVAQPAESVSHTTAPIRPMILRRGAISTMREATSEPVKPPVTPVKPPVTMHFNPILFQPVIINPNLNLCKTVFNVLDSVSKQPVYKSEISIIGTNNNIFREIESDKDGTIEFQLPIGNYKVKIKKDGYKIFEEELKIENNIPVAKNYSLAPESVTYDSFFLIGMICEKLPAIPRKQ
ncbi:carboxypeptidase-like regulatory domain-containing protein [Flavobacterium pedocola]